jgi:hypothetical protein
MHKAARIARRLYRRGAASALDLIIRLRARGLPPGQAIVRAGGLRVAQLRVEASPLQAQRENLDRVCSALTAVDVPFFCVRPLPGRPPAVAVRDAHRGRALSALAACGEPLFAAVQPHGKPRGGWTRAGRVLPLSRCLPAFSEAAVVRVAGYYASPSQTLVLGLEYGCDVEFWKRDGDRLVAPRPNGTTESVAAGGESAEGHEELFNPMVSPSRRRPDRYPTRPEFAVRLVDEVDFPIDAVYTWVDGADPIWRSRRDAALAEAGALRESAASEARFTSRDELRYSLRSLTACAPWIRRIWIVTDGQAPPWLDDTHPDITVVDHKEIFSDPSVLPVFNSHAIETQLHHIDGLSEHFLYLNDDFFLGRPLPASTFFEGNGLTRFFPSAVQVPFGAPELEESPVHAAGMNNRRLLNDLTGRTLTQKMKHVPYALRRSLLDELERRFAAEFAATSGHPFRECTDISVVSSLAHYYAYLTGRAVRGSIGYTYVDLALDRTKRKLRTMLALRQHDAFCLNDTAPTTPAQDALLAAFLESYYPTPSPFERRPA